MKQTIYTFLVLFLSLLSQNLFADALEKTVTFDFTGQDKIHPNVTIESGQTRVDVTDETFIEGPISISFPKIQNTWVNFSRVASELPDNPLTELIVLKNQKVSFDANGVEILSIAFEGGESGHFYQVSSEGSYSPGEWTNNGVEGVKNVILEANAGDVVMVKCHVTYRTAMDQLNLVSSNPVSGATVGSLKELDLTFTDEVSTVSGTFSVLNSSNQTVATLSSNGIEGEVVSFTLNNEIKAEGEYSIKFPKSSFKTQDGIYNSEFSLNFTVKEDEDIFNPNKIAIGGDSQGNPIGVFNDVDEIVNSIKIIFPGKIGNKGNAGSDVKDINNFTTNLIDKRTGNTIALLKGRQAATAQERLMLDMYDPDDLDTKINKIDTKGIYTFTIPEATVYNEFYGQGVDDGERYNEETVITFRVAGAVGPSAEVLEKAGAMLENTGVGYPKADATARVALENMVNAAAAEDAEFTTAMDDFLKSTEIEMPQVGKFYTIANVGIVGEEGPAYTYYLAYENGKVTVTDDKTKAYQFEVESSDDGVVVLKTDDGKFLHTLISNNDYTAVTSSNVSSEKGDANNITISKLNVTADAEKIFGLITLQGIIGKLDGAGDDIIAYSTIRKEKTIRDAATSVLYTEQASSAFMLEETTAPAPTPVETECEVKVLPESEGSIEALEKITVTFPTLTNVVYNNTEAPAYLLLGEAKIAPVTANVTGENGNVVEFTFGNLENGEYKFVAPDYAFSYEKNSKTVYTKEISTSFKVYNTDQFVEDYTKTHVMESLGGIHNDKVAQNAEDLNNIKFAYREDGLIKYVDIYPNDEMKFDIYVNKINYVTSGKFKRGVETTSYTEKVFKRNGVELGVLMNPDQEPSGVITLSNGDKYFFDASTDEIADAERVTTIYYLEAILDKKVDASNCPNGLVNIYFPTGMFGDINYHKYLTGEGGVSKKDCHISSEMDLTVNIDNSLDPIPVGIKNHEMGASKSNIIYDLSGRRISKMSKAGLYIINGKKIMKK